jgi:hypothetical protein
LAVSFFFESKMWNSKAPEARRLYARIIMCDFRQWQSGALVMLVGNCLPQGNKFDRSGKIDGTVHTKILPGVKASSSNRKVPSWPQMRGPRKNSGGQ